MRSLLESAGIALCDDKIVIPQECRSVRLDVGLSVNAPQSQVWLSRDPHLHVFGFEPVKANRESIEKGDSPWPVNLEPKLIGKRINIIPCALLQSHLPGGQTIYVTRKDPGCSSVLKPKTFEVAYEEIIQVESLNRFFDLFPFDQISYIDHLKIDVQGADLQVLEGATQYLSAIMAITAEVDTNEYEGTRNSLKSMKELLEPFGFKLFKKGWISKTIFRLKGIKCDIQCDDPTFINMPLFKDKVPKNFWAYQRG